MTPIFELFVTQQLARLLSPTQPFLAMHPFFTLRCIAVHVVCGCSHTIHCPQAVWAWAGNPKNTTIFNETVVFVNGLLEPGSTEDIVAVVQDQLDKGANPALALAMHDIIVHGLLGAVHLYL